MSEGVLTLSMNGQITTVNPAALAILGLSEEDVVSRPFATLFFEYQENDGFNQAILDAIYESEISHNATVDYFDGATVKKLFVNTSFLISNGEKIGVTAVLNDITELVELQDAVLAMEKIKALNGELEKRNSFIKKTFGRYLSDDIVNTILEKDDGLVIGGKKQVVTIMFTDIRGFTVISEQMLPDDLIRMLNYYLGEMIEIIQANGGTILEFIGDAIVVVFGAPIAGEDNDGAGVRCAIEMQRAMERVNAHNAKEGYPEMEMGIGIHTGDAVLGNIGSERKTKYDMIGHNVNLASRIETYTVGGQILISPTVKKNLGSRVKTRGEMEILPKGIHTPIKIYDVEACDGVKMPLCTQVFEVLDAPIDIKIQTIEGKSASDKLIDASVTEVSQRQARFKSGHKFKRNANIKFAYGGDDIYAKIVAAEGGVFTMHFSKGAIKA